MEKLSNTETELKKSVAYKKKYVYGLWYKGLYIACKELPDHWVAFP